MIRFKRYNQFINEEYNYSNLDTVANDALEMIEQWTGRELQDMFELTFTEKYELVKDNINKFLDLIIKNFSEYDINELIDSKEILISKIVNLIMMTEYRM